MIILFHSISAVFFHKANNLAYVTIMSPLKLSIKREKSWYPEMYLNLCGNLYTSNIFHIFAGGVLIKKNIFAGGDNLSYELNSKKDSSSSGYDRLKDLDPVAANRIHPNDHRKVRDVE